MTDITRAKPQVSPAALRETAPNIPLSPDRERGNPDPGLYAAQLGLLFGLYLLTAKFGLQLDAVSGVATPVWPPTGIALVALVLYGYRLWPAVALAALVVNATIHQNPLPSAVAIAAGNTLEAILGVWLLRRYVDFRPSLDRVRDVLGLAILAAGLSTLVSATIGTTSGWLGGASPLIITRKRGGPGGWAT